jgi:quercetin dioxygenase-like cupin family protein
MTLEQFVSDWLRGTIVQPPLRASEFVDGNAGVTLYRDDRFQVQLWVFPPNAKVTDHAHPGLDTWLVRVAGKLKFRLHGKYKPLSEMERTEWGGMKTWTLHVPPGVSHGADIGPEGASFLSLTERLDGEHPESVHLIWDGPPLDEKHGQVLRKAA